MDDQFINKLLDILETNVENEHFGVSELANEMGMSRSNLHRKIITASKISANQYIRQFRLQKGMEMLKQTSFTVSEVSYKVGFSSPAYFIKCFHDYYGYSPGGIGSRNETETDAEIAKPNNKRLAVIVSSVVFMVLLAVLLFMVVKPFSKNDSETSKSIAVLHFEDLSPAEAKGYIIAGLREEIINNLFSIKGLNVIPGALIDQYKNSNLSVLEIARKIKADFILTAKGETSNENTTVWFELIEAKTGNQKWRENKSLTLTNFNEVRKNVAFAVVNELEGKLSDDEIKEIEKIPTDNIASWNFYLEGRNYEELLLSGYKPEYVLKAKKSYEKAIELDSSYNEPYFYLAKIYESELAPFTNNIELADAYRDSGFVLYKKGLELDQVPTSRRFILHKLYSYYLRKGLYNEAENIEKRIEWTEEEKNSRGYHEVMFANKYRPLADYYNMIKSYYNHNKSLPEGLSTHMYLIDYTNWSLANMGYPEVAHENAKLFIEQYDDSVRFYKGLQLIELLSGNYKTAIGYNKRLNLLDSANTNVWITVYCCVMLNDYDAAFSLVKKLENNSISPNCLYGFVYSKKSESGKVRFHYSGHLVQCQKEIKFNTESANNLSSHVNLASIYSVTGQTEKAFEYLRIVNQHNNIPLWIVNSLKDFPMFENIRNEPEFQKILADLEAKYQKEHDRVGELLRELGEIE